MKVSVKTSDHSSLLPPKLYLMEDVPAGKIKCGVETPRLCTQEGQRSLDADTSWRVALGCPLASLNPSFLTWKRWQ